MPASFPQDGCKQCADPLGFDFTFAFQPLVQIQEGKIWGYEALVRGPQGESAWSVLSRVNDSNRYAFDQACRVKAITLAAELKLETNLSINFLPNAVYEPAHCIRSTLRAAEASGFPIDRIMFEITESEKVHDPDHLVNIFSHYKQQGFITALDDFGAGHAGLNLLSRFIPDLLKIDMQLIRDIDTDTTKQVIARGLIGICKELGIRVLAEGIETQAEMAFYRDQGVELMQGYYFARPGFEQLPAVQFDL